MKEINVKDLVWSSEEGSLDLLEDLLDSKISMKYDSNYISAYSQNEKFIVIPTFKTDNFMAEQLTSFVGLDSSISVYEVEGFNVVSQKSPSSKNLRFLGGR